MWEDLKSRIEALPEYRRLVRELGPDNADVSVSGLCGAARSLVLASLSSGRSEPFLVIASDPVRARDILADTGIFGVEDVVSYPEDEILPYDYHDPDRDLTGLQMTALEALSMGRCRVLVCTLRSVLKKVFRPETFRSMVVVLEKGGEYDPVELSGRLIHLGYERHEIVEAKGQFALRGGILDIFEVGEETPVRMEYDGDVIFSMRDFDVETQRSTGERAGIRIRPLHHLIPDADGIEHLRRRLERETAGMDEESRTRMMLPARRLERGISFFGMEHYAAAIHDVVPLFSYFTSEPALVMFDAEEIEKALGDVRGEIERRYEQSKEEGHLYPAPDEVYLNAGELEGWFKESRRLEFRNLGWDGAVVFDTGAPGDYRRNFKGLLGEVKKELRRGTGVFLFCSNVFQKDRAEELFSEVSLEIDFPIGELSNGFRWPGIGILILSEEEVFGRYHRPYHKPRSRSRSLTYDPSHFQPSDFVVHVNHGIGRYMGMRVLEIDGGKTECLDIRYEGDDHLFIPVTKLRMVERYVAAEGLEPRLNRLGGAAWMRARKRARRSAEKIAKELLEIYAARQIAEGFAFDRDKPWQNELEASFPYEETPHQLQATSEVKVDLESKGPMDRLLCGDVGFGKTEVAVRAAFKAVMSGKQCAVLVPTTVLALQHYNTITDRLQGYPVNVAMLSRFLSATEQKKVIGDTAGGSVDIVIGTHRLLSRDVGFKDLGLLIIDEEHRFGVRHKEAFKKIKRSVDVLSMTATPIPRTLSMAVSGIRDISVIDTPPRNRLPIHTEILPFDDDRIREAVMREVDRGGQVFFVHNRVQSIAVMEGYLGRLLPGNVRISHAHGQMKETELEKKMIDFLGKRFDVLVCTLIIEAGLDFPNVNTIIINRADRFGLAQLYQLRGRVGRSDRKAYAYMLVPKERMLTATAVKRLQAISEFDYLGAGYRIAMRDLEIRGAGNLLGHQQSGQINAVGLDLYSRMLREEVARLKGEPLPDEREIRISIPLPAYLPDSYIRDAEERVDIYRRLTGVADTADAGEIKDELGDRFGPMPEPAENLLEIVSLKVRARKAGIDRIEADGGGILRFEFGGGNVPGKKALAEIAGAFEGRLTFHTEKAFSLSIRTCGVGTGDRRNENGDILLKRIAATSDIENLLNLLESYDI